MVSLNVIEPLIRDGLPLVGVTDGQVTVSVLIGGAAAGVSTFARLAATPSRPKRR